ncbi:MAG TPA: hypothetical protein VNS57_07370, partial [Steroidobacteraceae bacterium]|nr:hypothetical protein [Steroidobacteraceae bacterium]
LDIVFRLAEDHGIVLLNGSGFEAPDWSVRVSFANLDDHVYDDIGRAVRAVARSYVRAYEAATGIKVAPARSPMPATTAPAVPQLAPSRGEKATLPGANAKRTAVKTKKTGSSHKPAKA